MALDAKVGASFSEGSVCGLWEDPVLLVSYVWKLKAVTIFTFLVPSLLSRHTLSALHPSMPSIYSQYLR